MRDKKSYLLYPNCSYCVYYMIQYKVISKKYKKEAVFLGKVLEYSFSSVINSPVTICSRTSGSTFRLSPHCHSACLSLVISTERSERRNLKDRHV